MADLSATLRQPFAEQVAAFRLRLGTYRDTSRWDDLRGAEHDRAFMVAGAVGADLLGDLAAAVGRGIAEGATLEDFRRDFRAIVERRGWHGWTGEGSAKGEAWRTRVIWETNMRTSYAAGRMAQLVEGDFAFWIYRHGGSREPRPQHLAWDGLTLPPEHPFWASHAPPNGWGCSCSVTGARTAGMARRMGGDPDLTLPEGWDRPDPRTGAPPGIDRGWAHSPGASVAEPISVLARKLDGLPARLAGDMIRSWIQGGPFKRWIDDADNAEPFPLARIPEADAAAIGAKTPVAVMSSETRAKQVRLHPELTPADYSNAQMVISAPTWRVQDTDRSLIYISEKTGAGGGYVLIVGRPRRHRHAVSHRGDLVGRSLGPDLPQPRRCDLGTLGHRDDADRDGAQPRRRAGGSPRVRRQPGAGDRGPCHHRRALGRHLPRHHRLGVGVGAGDRARGAGRGGGVHRLGPRHARHAPGGRHHHAARAVRRWRLLGARGPHRGADLRGAADRRCRRTAGALDHAGPADLHRPHHHAAAPLAALGSGRAGPLRGARLAPRCRGQCRRRRPRGRLGRSARLSARGAGLGPGDADRAADEGDQQPVAASRPAHQRHRHPQAAGLERNQLVGPRRHPLDRLGAGRRRARPRLRGRPARPPHRPGRAAGARRALGRAGRPVRRPVRPGRDLVGGDRPDRRRRTRAALHAGRPVARGARRAADGAGGAVLDAQHRPRQLCHRLPAADRAEQPGGRRGAFRRQHLEPAPRAGQPAGRGQHPACQDRAVRRHRPRSGRARGPLSPRRQPLSPPPGALRDRDGGVHPGAWATWSR